MASGYVIPIIIDASGTIKGGKDAQRALQKVLGTAGKADKSVSKMEASMKRAGVVMKAALAAGALAAAFALRALVKETLAFGTAIREVGTLLPGQADELKKIERSSLALAAAYGGSAKDQAKGFYQAISAGATSAAAATELLDVANRLAIGGVTEVEIGVDGLTTILNSYGLAATEAESVSDALFVAMKLGKTTVGELASTIGTVAPIAAQAGVGFDKVLAAIAALTKGGISTDMAMTGMRAMLVSILKPASEATIFAEKLGIEFNAQALKAKGLEGVLRDVAIATKGDAEAIAQLFPNVRALTPALALAGKAAADFEMGMKAMEDRAGSTQEAFGTMSKDAAFQLSKLKANIVTTAVAGASALAEKLLPKITAVNVFLDKLRDNWDDINVAWVILWTDMERAVNEFIIALVDQIADILDHMAKLEALNNKIALWDSNVVADAAVEMHLLSEGLRLTQIEAGALAQSKIDEILSRSSEGAESVAANLDKVTVAAAAAGDALEDAFGGTSGGAGLSGLGGALSNIARQLENYQRVFGKIQGPGAPAQLDPIVRDPRPASQQEIDEIAANSKKFFEEEKQREKNIHDIRMEQLENIEDAIFTGLELAHDLGIEFSKGTKQWITFALTMLKWIRKLQTAAAAADAQSSAGALGAGAGAAGGVGAGAAVVAAWAVVVAAIAGIIIGGAKILKSRSENAKEETWGAVLQIRETADGIEQISSSLKSSAGMMGTSMLDFISGIEDAANITITGLAEINIFESSKGSFAATVGDQWRTVGMSMVEVAMQALAEGIKQSDLGAAGPAVRDLIQKLPQNGDMEALEKWFKRLEVAVKVDRMFMTDAQRATDDFQRALSDLVAELEEAGLSMEVISQAVAQTWIDERERILATLGLGPDPMDLALRQRDAFNTDLEARRQYLAGFIKSSQTHIASLLAQLAALDAATAGAPSGGGGKGAGIGIGGGPGGQATRLIRQLEKLQEQLTAAERELAGLPGGIEGGARGKGAGKSRRDQLASMLDQAATMAGVMQDEFGTMRDHFREMRELAAKIRMSEEQRALLNAEILEREQQASEQLGMKVLDRIYQQTNNEEGMAELERIRFEAQRAHDIQQIDFLLASGKITDKLAEKLMQARSDLENFEFPVPDESQVQSWENLMSVLNSFKRQASDAERLRNAFDDAMRFLVEQHQAGIDIADQFTDAWDTARMAAEDIAFSMIDTLSKAVGSEKDIAKVAKLRHFLEVASFRAQAQLLKPLLDPETFAWLTDLIDQFAGMDPNAGSGGGRGGGRGPVVTAIEDQTDSLLAGWQSLMDDLLTGPNSPLSPKQQLDFFQKEYNKLLGLARGGDQDAEARLQQLIPGFVEAQKTFTGGTATTAFNDFFTGLFSDISSLSGLANPLLGLGFGGGGTASTDNVIGSFREFQVAADRHAGQAHTDSRDLKREVAQMSQRLDLALAGQTAAGSG